MPIYAVSDLHLGDRGPRDNFNSREKEFQTFLDFVDRDSADLVICGDLFEWWQCSLGRTLKAYADLLSRLCEMEAMWVQGNHDGLLVDLPYFDLGYSLPDAFPADSLVKEIGGLTFRFSHGHQYDPYCNTVNPGTGELAAIAAGLIEDRRAGEPGVETRFLGGLESIARVWQGFLLQDDRKRNVVAEALEDGPGVVHVLGHTHEAGEVAGRLYNCGCWVEDRNTFVRVEDDGTAAVYEWLPNGSGMSPYGHALEVGD